MPVIKLSDEEATLFFTDQFNQNNPIQKYQQIYKIIGMNSSPNYPQF